MSSTGTKTKPLPQLQSPDLRSNGHMHQLARFHNIRTKPTTPHPPLHAPLLPRTAPTPSLLQRHPPTVPNRPQHLVQGHRHHAPADARRTPRERRNRERELGEQEQRRRKRGTRSARVARRRPREKCFVVVLANGTTRLQLDLATSSGDGVLRALLEPAARRSEAGSGTLCRRAAELLGLRVGECVVVAAHADDVDAVGAVGMGAACVRRDTEDADFEEEDFGKLRGRAGFFMDGRGGRDGLDALADVLGI